MRSSAGTFFGGMVASSCLSWSHSRRRPAISTGGMFSVVAMWSLVFSSPCSTWSMVSKRGVAIQQALFLEGFGDFQDQFAAAAGGIGERCQHPDGRGVEGENAEQFDAVAGGALEEEILGQTPLGRVTPSTCPTSSIRKRSATSTMVRYRVVRRTLAGSATLPISRSSPPESAPSERMARSGRERRYL